ncbi:MAG: trypsin-like serine protease [Rhodospirillales bacterium]|nr:trypsin-like serine protease [Rhodospirillales bacterium]
MADGLEGGDPLTSEIKAIESIASTVADGSRTSLALEFKNNITDLQRWLDTAVQEGQSESDFNLDFHRIENDVLVNSIAYNVLTGAAIQRQEVSAEQVRGATRLISAKAQPVSINTQSIITGMDPATRQNVTDIMDDMTWNLLQRQEALGRVLQQDLGNSKDMIEANAQEVEQSLAITLDVKSFLQPESQVSERVNPRLQRAMEETLQALTRPMFPICNGNVWLREDQDVEGWAPKVANLLNLHPKVSQAVGNIRIRGKPDGAYQWVGTGFVVGPDLIVTNAHVAKAFAFPEDDNWFIYSDTEVEFTTGVEDEACIPPAQKNVSHQVLAVVAAGDGKGEDFALLRVVSDSLPQPLVLSPSRVSSGEDVVLLGYPAEPTAIHIGQGVSDVEEARRRLFSTPDGRMPFSIKRISPGRSLNDDTNGKGIPFNYNSFGGNSGSPVVRLADGVVVAIHLGGIPQQQVSGGYNLGMPAHTIRPIIDTVLQAQSSN